MTSLILIENYNLSDYIEISLPSDYIYEGKVAYLKSGQKMTVESLLEFIHSENLYVSPAEFLESMKQHDKSIGLEDQRQLKELDLYGA